MFKRILWTVTGFTFPYFILVFLVFPNIDVGPALAIMFALLFANFIGFMEGTIEGFVKGAKKP